MQGRLVPDGQRGSSITKVPAGSSLNLCYQVVLTASQVPCQVAALLQDARSRSSYGSATGGG